MLPVFNINKNPRFSKKCQRNSTQSNQKSFHFQRETFYHNNFKKLKPTQILFKQNQNNLSYFQKTLFDVQLNDKIKQMSTTLPKFVQTSMRNKKDYFQESINQSLTRVNRSFNRYYQGKTIQQIAFNKQKKKAISSKNILKQLKQMQSTKKFNLPLVNLNQKNILQMASAQVNYQIVTLQNGCFDTMFPFERYGPALNNYQNQLIIYGGFVAGKKPIVSCFHKFNLQTKIWTKVQQASGNLGIVPCFHTINIYKGCLVLVGGVSINPESQKRKFNADICIFNFDKKQWLKLRATIAIRSHASTLFGNTLLIHGGIDDKQCNSNLMHFINFNSNSIQSSIIISTENKSSLNGFKQNLSHHKLVNTNQVQQNLKMLLKYDGVFCFGGVNGEGQMHNQLTFLNCIGKENALDVRFQHWVIVQLNEKQLKPQPRKNHTLNILNKRALLILIGGQNTEGQILNDIWIFDLIKLQWKVISPISSVFSEIVTDSHFIKSHKIDQGISGHCGTFMGSRLYVFGGKKTVENKKQNCLWCIQTDVINNISKKLKIQKSINTSINTIKQSSKSLQSMWNIQF